MFNYNIEYEINDHVEINRVNMRVLILAELVHIRVGVKYS